MSLKDADAAVRRSRNSAPEGATSCVARILDAIALMRFSSPRQVLLFVLLLTGCSSSAPVPGAYVPGGGSQAQPPNVAPGGGSQAQAPNVAPGSGSPPPLSAVHGPTNRLIQEADIYKLVGNTLYILNATYRGLQIVDVTNAQSPQRAGSVLVTGSPRQIYVEGNTAYVLVSGSFDYDCGGYKGICGWEAPTGVSTLVLAVDVTNIASPQVLGQMRIDGDLQDSRIVGNILYVISNTNTLTYVASLDVSKPQAFAKIQEIDFPFNQWDVGVFANVSNSRIIIAGSGDECDATNIAPNCREETSVTQFTPIDITDPEGHLVQGKPFVGSGVVMDRWAMDFDPTTGLFRAVLSSDSPHVNSGGGSLTMWSASTINAATQLGSVTFVVGDNITAAAFASSRVYVFSALQATGCPAPLVVFDTSHPEKPTQLGSVTVRGAVDFLYPLGEELLALGHAETNCAAFQGTGALAVSLIDVSSGAEPKLLSEVTFGGQTAAVAASKSDLKKVFLVLQQLGLILVPYQNVRDTTAPGATQLIDFSPNGLTLRGAPPHDGLLERAFPVQNDVAAFSDQDLQVIDITNRDTPTTVATLNLR